MTARAERTRERLLDAAEPLYARRGVEGVSLREIRLAAGQRNSSALQYHFGNADGLLRALAQRHMPRVGTLTERLRGELAPPGSSPEPGALLEVLVRPWADYISHGPSARARIRIAAETSAHPERTWQDFQQHAPPVLVEVGAALLDHLQLRYRPRLALDRLTRMNLAALHLCADRARQADNNAAGSDLVLLHHQDWADDLVDTSIAALLASARGAHRLDQPSAPG